MSFGAVVLLALGLALDAAAVLAARAGSGRIVPRSIALSIALCFGAFHVIMPLAGAFLGSRIGVFVEAWDHWIAFGLLALVGLHMIWEAIDTPGTRAAEAELFRPRVVLMLAFATSLDAFAVGITLPLLGVPLLSSLLTIGVVAVLASLFGLYVGRRFGAALGVRLDAVGGLVLIAIGAKILLDHLSAG